MDIFLLNILKIFKSEINHWQILFRNVSSCYEEILTCIARINSEVTNWISNAIPNCKPKMREDMSFISMEPNLEIYSLPPYPQSLSPFPGPRQQSHNSWMTIVWFLYGSCNGSSAGRQAAADSFRFPTSRLENCLENYEDFEVMVTILEFFERTEKKRVETNHCMLRK